MRNRFIVQAWLMLMPFLLFAGSVAQVDTTQGHSLRVKIPKFSFGIAYVPYYSGTDYLVQYNPLQNSKKVLEWEAVSRSFTELQGTFRVHVTRRVTFALNVSYNGYSEDQSVKYSVVDVEIDTSVINTATSFTQKYDFRQLKVRFGALWYLKRPESKRTAPFVTFGMDKIFAWTKSRLPDSRNPIFPNMEIKSDDNASEFVRDLNSPWGFDLGFGAEYFFNNSLSLNAFVSWYVFFRQATLKIVQDDEWSSTRTSYSNQVKRTDHETHIGLGLNFYF